MEEEREATLDSEPTTRVVVILIDHIKNTDDQTTTASRCELLMTSKFSETRLDFLYKETLIYLAKRFDRKDFISLYHNDRKFVLALLKSDCIDADILPQLLEYFASLMKLTSEDEEIIALLMIKNHLSQNQVNGMAHLLEYNTRFLHQVASYGFFLDKLTDRDFVIDLVMEKPKRYKSLSSDMKNDREVAKAAFSKRGSLITNEFYNDRELLLIALTNDGSVYYNLDEELKNDLEIINIAVKTCPELLSELDGSFFNDVEFSERAVKLLPNVLKFVPQILEDLELVKRVFSAEVLPYLKSIHLQDDEIRSQVENLVKECKENYTRASSDLRMDKKLALLALENGVKLSYILIQDYDCYKLAITKNPQTIFFCDPEFLKSHFDLVDLAFSLHGPMLYYDLPSNIKHDPICVMKIIEKEPSVFSSLEKELKQDEQVLSLYYSLLDTSKETVKLVEGKKLDMNTSFQTKPFYDFTPSDFSNIKPFSLDTSNSAFKFGLSNTSNTATTSTSTTTTNNGELVNPFANKNPFSLTSSNSSSTNTMNPFSKPVISKTLTLQEEIYLSNDKNFLKQVFEKDAFLFRYCNENLKKDQEFILELITKHTGAIFQFADNSLKEDKDFVLKAIPISVTVSKFISPNLKEDKEIILKALKTSPVAYAFFDNSVLFCGDQDIAYRAVKSNLHILKTISIDYFKDRKFVSQLFKLMFRKKKYKKKKNGNNQKTTTTNSTTTNSTTTTATTSIVL